jgi:hypothetical protein
MLAELAVDGAKPDGEMGRGDAARECGGGRCGRRGVVHSHLGSIARTISATLSVIARASLNFLLERNSQMKHAIGSHPEWKTNRSSLSARRISLSLSALAPPISPARRNWMNDKKKSAVILGFEYLFLQPRFSNFRLLALQRMKPKLSFKKRANIPFSCRPPQPPRSSSRTRRCVPCRLRTCSSTVTTHATESWRQ